MSKILILVDVQNDFTSGVLGNAECEAVVPKIAGLMQSDEYDAVYLTMDVHREDYFETQEGKKLPTPHCIIGTVGCEVRDEITDALGSLNKEYSIFSKSTFGSLRFAEFLKQQYGKKQADLEIDFVGVCTGICVISNVLLVKAALPEVSVRVIEDCCACVTPESHKTAIDAMRMCQVDIIKSER